MRGRSQHSFGLLAAGLTAALCALAVTAADAHAQPNPLPSEQLEGRPVTNVLPRELEGVGVTEHLNAQLPLEVNLRDEQGAPVRLGQFFDGRRPVVLTLFYDRCPMLCNLVLNAQVTALRNTLWTVGEQYDVVAVSIDPRERPEESRSRRDRLVRSYNRGGSTRGWHVLTGDEANVRRLANAIGFQYRYDARQNQYAHPAAIFVVTPTGRVARYLYGIEFRPNDVRLALLEASEGRSINTVERVLLFCFHYDPQGQKYVLLARRVMQLGGAVCAVALGAMLVVLKLRERSRRNDRGTGGGPYRTAAGDDATSAAATASPATTTTTPGVPSAPPQDARS